MRKNASSDDTISSDWPMLILNIRLPSGVKLYNTFAVLFPLSAVQPKCR